MIFKRNKKNEYKKQAEDAIKKNDLANRKGVWTPSLEDRRRLVIQDLFLSTLITGGHMDFKIFTGSIMRHSLIPTEEDFNEETRIRAENDMQALSTLTTEFIVKMNQKGGH